MTDTRDSFEKIAQELRERAETADMVLGRVGQYELKAYAGRIAALQSGAGDGAVTEAMVLRACNAYNKACGEGLSDDFYADYPEMYAAIKAAIAEPSND